MTMTRHFAEYKTSVQYRDREQHSMSHHKQLLHTAQSWCNGRVSAAKNELPMCRPPTKSHTQVHTPAQCHCLLFTKIRQQLT